MTAIAYSLESLPVAMQREIVNTVTRLSLKNSYLDMQDIQMLTGFSENKVREMMKDPRFPPCSRLTPGGQKKWKNAHIQAFLDSKQQDW